MGHGRARAELEHERRFERRRRCCARVLVSLARCDYSADVLVLFCKGEIREWFQIVERDLMRF